MSNFKNLQQKNNESYNLELADKLMNMCYLAVKTDRQFPRDTGHLQDEALDVRKTNFGFELFLHCNDINKGAPYQFYLEYGTNPHFIHNAFGKGFSVVHPGSVKHVGFWSNHTFATVANTIINLTNGKVVK